MNTYEILHSPFDVKTHKENFINYLEVLILKDGTIEQHQIHLRELHQADLLQAI